MNVTKSRDENGWERLEKPSSHFRFHIFIREQKQNRKSSVGKTKSVIRDIRNDAIQSGTNRLRLGNDN